MTLSRLWRPAVLTLALTLALPSRPFAHEIPPSVRVFVLVKPDAERLRLIVRLPLESVRDIEFPQRGAEYLDISRATPLLTDAARLWVADYIEFHEDGRPLPTGRVAAARVS